MASRPLASAVLLLVGLGACAGEVLNPLDCKKDKDCKKGFICVGNRCVLECETDVDCDDGNVCSTDICDLQRGCQHLDNAESCEDGNPCSENDACIAQQCIPGTPALDGAVCDADGLSETRDICLAAVCGPSRCGDGFLDRGSSPAEECDDGNTNNLDGCQGDCTILPPQLTIVFPDRGATLSGSSTVTVRGVAEDPILGLDGVTVNGAPVTVQPGGVFSHEMTAVHGLNTVEVIATNHGGKAARQTRGFYWSTAYAAYDTPPAASDPLPAALVMDLSQAVLDDRDHPCTYGPSGYSCTAIDDIATLGEIILNNLDLSATVGQIRVFQRTTTFLSQRYVFGPYTNLLGLPLTVGGDIVVNGSVIVAVDVTELDLNTVALALDARTGGADADIRVDTQDSLPGISMTVVTTVEVPITAAFDPASITIAYDDYETYELACLALDLFGYCEDVDIICPCGNASLAPIASLTQNPKPFVESGLSVGTMRMQATFTITATPGGGADVTLVAGDVDFEGSTIDVEPIRDMQINLGTIDVLGAEFELGTVPLEDIAPNLNSAMNTLLGLILNDLQPLAEVAISLLLLNPSDPLTVGGVLEDALNALAPQGALELPVYAGQAAAPEVTIDSAITAVDCRATSGGNILTGGIKPTLEVLYSSAKVVQRNPLGSIQATGCYGSPVPALSFPDTSRLELAEQIDHLNQALFAVWHNGGFDFVYADEHLPPGSPLAGQEFSVAHAFLTAPILDNCAGAPLALQVADVRLVGSFGAGSATRTFEAYASLSLPVQVAVSGDQVALAAAAAAPRVVFEIVTPRTPPPWAAELEALVVPLLRDQVLVRYGSTILGAMPTFAIDLRAFLNDPAAATLRFLPASGAMANDYLRLSGAAE